MSASEDGILLGQEIRKHRNDILIRSDLQGVGLVRMLSEHLHGWLTTLASELPTGWALATIGGTARQECCPGSDVDLLLLHPSKAKHGEISKQAESLWYPLWDAGLKVSPLTHSVKSAIELATFDLPTATTLLDIVSVSADESPVSELRIQAASLWRKHAGRWLGELATTTSQRHEKAGEVAFLLEPDLKEGRGGLRDVQAIRWAVHSQHASVESALEIPLEDLQDDFDCILGVRAELHRTTGRVSDRLLLQEQDVISSKLNSESADALMSDVAAAARNIAWVSDRFWWRVSRDIGKRSTSAPQPVAPGLAIDQDALVLLPDTNLHDRALTFRAAATAALNDLPLGRSLLQTLVSDGRQEHGADWTAEMLRWFVALLGAGPAALGVIESLDRYGLFVDLLPEWAAVQSKPQRNAYHRFTVDWHLLHTAIEANTFVREVARPDLLLLGAFLHDIGKGFPGDHTEVGEVIIDRIGSRMGLAPDDVTTLIRLCRYHLLLAETATRRDIADPGTAAMVASAVETADFLDLLRALTESDSKATGSSAWSDWKRRLIDDLVAHTKARIGGHRPAVVEGFPAERHLKVMQAARSSGAPQFETYPEASLSPATASQGVTRCIVATPDEPGLLAKLAGVLSLHGVDVLSVDAWTSDDSIAVDELRVARRIGGETNWERVREDFSSALAGNLDFGVKLDQRARSYGPTKITSADTSRRVEILVDNEISADSSVVELRAPDGIGLLWRVTNALSELGVDIRHAKVATLGHEVVDVFYLRNKVGDTFEKIRDPETLAQIRELLRSSIEA